MALNATSWTSAITTAMDSAGLFDDLTPNEQTAIYDAWKIVCQGHINHITNNAIVDVELIGMATGSGTPGGPLAIGLPTGTQVTGQGNPIGPPVTGGIT